ncbi:MAG: nickel-dependent lactate racemase [Spirochaetales bacterium]|nr:nickel-dependent lactate racemase [Spirochaetales bacterium]
MEQEFTRIAFPYTDERIAYVDVPTRYLHQVHDLPKVKPLANVDQAVEDAIAHPIGTKRLGDVVKVGDRVAIIVDDITRPTPAYNILPAVLKELASAHIANDQIVIVMALGSHRYMTDEEIDTKISKEIHDTYRVTQSHFNDPGQLTLVGTSEDGVDIYIDSEVARADVKIGIGSIVPHGAVGWSGGGKIIYPGIAGESTVTRFHYTHGLTEQNLTGIDETVVRSRMERWVEVVGLQFIVNCVLTPSAEVYHVVAGHYIKAHRAGVAKAQKAYIRHYDRQDGILISIPYPHDPDLWQAGKGFYCAESLVKDGGAILVATPCPEGIGLHASYPERIGRDDNVEIIKSILDGTGELPEDPIPLAPGAMMAKIRKRINLHMASPGLSEQLLEKSGIMWHESVRGGLDYLLTKYDNPSISVVLSAEICFKKSKIID